MLRFEKGPGKRVAEALVARVATKSLSGRVAVRMRLRLACGTSRHLDAEPQITFASQPRVRVDWTGKPLNLAEEAS